ncbi:uncharacterized protein FOMMEDRAFT_132114 [Fomitiporia mediterranea MF3/22]|uniref:uncharacterized protein n=1 Tax=Fomitiporia mediterranea (strain MF3/22) TaxID=694068 RepID=UPI0004408565|nr:uncharacterized protein FOMMEDRAFT_132114 [Fomitiporia mediterranea MF3/22]EJD05654.1 hypothetical protein FOMMEDRAFT_132114 [Fomitiporia mediterranea MF3/22]
MGAGQSKSDHGDPDDSIKIPVQFSPGVVNQLADASATPDPSPERQSSIDAQIRSRISAEIQRLRREEEEVRREIEASLEKENLDREIGTGSPTEDTTSENEEEEGEGEDGSRKRLNSTVLLGDLEEVKQRVDKFRSKKEEVEQHPAEQAARALSTCYANNPGKPLDCWREVSAFKASVAQLEQDYIASFR